MTFRISGSCPPPCTTLVPAAPCRRRTPATRRCPHDDPGQRRGRTRKGTPCFEARSLGAAADHSSDVMTTAFHHGANAPARDVLPAGAMRDAAPGRNGHPFVSLADRASSPRSTRRLRRRTPRRIPLGRNGLDARAPRRPHPRDSKTLVTERKRCRAVLGRWGRPFLGRGHSTDRVRPRGAKPFVAFGSRRPRDEKKRPGSPRDGVSPGRPAFDRSIDVCAAQRGSLVPTPPASALGSGGRDALPSGRVHVSQDNDDRALGSAYVATSALPDESHYVHACCRSSSGRAGARGPSGQAAASRGRFLWGAEMRFKQGDPGAVPRLRR